MDSGGGLDVSGSLTLAHMVESVVEVDDTVMHVVVRHAGDGVVVGGGVVVGAHVEECSL